MNETILTWNPANWFTVVLMAALGFALLGLGQKLYQNHLRKGA